MSLESTPDLTREETASSKFPVIGGWRVLYGLFVIALPSFSFWVIPGLKPEWQSGELDAYLALLLQPEASIFFLALLAYSIICYILLLIHADRFSPFFMVRLGIYTGVFLALQYTILLGLYLFQDRYSFLILLLWLFPLYFPKIYRWAARKWGRQSARLGLTVFILIAIVIVAVINREQFFPLFLALIGLVIAAPFWSFLIAGQAALWLYKNHETGLSLSRGLGLTAWLSGYVAAWRYDILKMYELYAQLPTAPPDCYIATAATHGHAQFVGARTVQRSDGKTMQVNEQLQILKCFELALLAFNPLLHKILRAIYDEVGKSLARKIQNPFLADIAYLLLKPFEWLTGAVLKVIVPEIDSIYKGIYAK